MVAKIGVTDNRIIPVLNGMFHGFLGVAMDRRYRGSSQGLTRGVLKQAGYNIVVTSITACRVCTVDARVACIGIPIVITIISSLTIIVQWVVVIDDIVSRGFHHLRL